MTDDARNTGPAPDSSAETPDVAGAPVGKDGRALVRSPMGGWIRRGGLKGNRGGGRPSEKFKLAMQKDLKRLMGIAAEIADDKNADASDRLNALKFIRDNAMGGKLRLEPVRERVDETFRAIERVVAPRDPDLARELVLAVERVWR